MWRSITPQLPVADVAASQRWYRDVLGFEIAWTRAVTETGTREGKVLAPFLTRGLEGFNVDDEEDWARAEVHARVSKRSGQ